MVRTYDNWERLAEAVIRREQLRQIGLDDSMSPSTSSLTSTPTFSSNSRPYEVSSRTSPSPQLPDEVNHSGGRRNKWKFQDIFLKLHKFTHLRKHFIFSKSALPHKKDYGIAESKISWARARRSMNGLEPKIHNCDEISQMIEEARSRNEIARLRELKTFKGHIESVMKEKGLDIDSIHHYYTL